SGKPEQPAVGRLELCLGERELRGCLLGAGGQGGIPGPAVFLRQDPWGDRVRRATAGDAGGRVGPERRAVGLHAPRVGEGRLTTRSRRRLWDGGSAKAAPAAR